MDKNVALNKAYTAIAKDDGITLEHAKRTYEAIVLDDGTVLLDGIKDSFGGIVFDPNSNKFVDRE